jgi:hypothetical protein
MRENIRDAKVYSAIFYTLILVYSTIFYTIILQSPTVVAGDAEHRPDIMVGSFNRNLYNLEKSIQETSI